MSRTSGCIGPYSMNAAVTVVYLSWHAPCSHFRQEPDTGFDALEEIRQMELLVGPMDAIVRQTEAHQHHRDPECFLNQVHYRDGAPAAEKHGKYAETLTIGPR